MAPRTHTLAQRTGDDAKKGILMILDTENVAGLWQAKKTRAVQLAAEIERIRVALHGYTDSDLASLAESIMRQNHALAADNERWRNAIESPLPVPLALEVARNIEAAIGLLQDADSEQATDAAYFAGYTVGYRDGYGNRRLVDAGKESAC
jgi:hypothetical protein